MVIDDALMGEAMRLTGSASKRATVTSDRDFAPFFDLLGLERAYASSTGVTS